MHLLRQFLRQSKQFLIYSLDPALQRYRENL